MEDVITKCKAWVASDTFCVKWKIEDDLVSELLSIWLSATVNGVNLFRIVRGFDSLLLVHFQTISYLPLCRRDFTT